MHGTRNNKFNKICISYTNELISMDTIMQIMKFEYIYIFTFLYVNKHVDIYIYIYICTKNDINIYMLKYMYIEKTKYQNYMYINM